MAPACLLILVLLAIAWTSSALRHQAESARGLLEGLSSDSLSRSVTEVTGLATLLLANAGGEEFTELDVRIGGIIAAAQHASDPKLKGLRQTLAALKDALAQYRDQERIRAEATDTFNEALGRVREFAHRMPNAGRADLMAARRLLQSIDTFGLLASTLDADSAMNLSKALAGGDVGTAEAFASYRQRPLLDREREWAAAMERLIETLKQNRNDLLAAKASAGMAKEKLARLIHRLAVMDANARDDFAKNELLSWITSLAWLGAMSLGWMAVTLRTQLRRRVEPLVHAVRTAIYGKPEPYAAGPEAGPFRDLADAFNDLLQEHARATEEAKNSQESLDLRVRARTTELWKANKKLQEESLKRESAEREFQQAQKMDALGKLAGSIAHDFNNLLTVILGGVECAMRKLPGDNEIAGILKTVEQAAERGAGLTRPLLAFSRNQVHATEPVSLNEATSEAMHIARRLLGVNIEVRVQLCPHLKLIEANPNQVQQVLMNLAVNARDAMDGKGILTIVTENVTVTRDRAFELGVRDDAEWVVLRVSDTGCGMDEVTRQRIFEPFFTTKPVGRGTGLGLATVFGIVRQCGGFMEVQSAPGEGATFQIYLPATLKEMAPPAAEPSVRMEENHQEAHETLLLVDDEEDIREFAAMTLQEVGYTVISAPSAADAIVLAERHAQEIALVVTDVTMPGMNGVQLAEVLTRRFQGTKILFVSGHSDEAVYAESLRGVEVHFLQKPYRSEELIAKVRGAIHGVPGQDGGGKAAAVPPEAGAYILADGDDAWRDPWVDSRFLENSSR